MPGVVPGTLKKTGKGEKMVTDLKSLNTAKIQETTRQ